MPDELKSVEEILASLASKNDSPLSLPLSSPFYPNAVRREIECANLGVEYKLYKLELIDAISEGADLDDIHSVDPGVLTSTDKIVEALTHPFSKEMVWSGRVANKLARDASILLVLKRYVECMDLTWS